MKTFIHVLIAVVVTVSLLLLSVPIQAAASPPNANTTAIGMSLTILNTSNVPASHVHVGDLLHFRITMSIGSAPGFVPVNFQGGTIALRVATHPYQIITASVPLVTETTPFTVDSPFTYTVAAADIGVGGNPGNIRAEADYGTTADYPSGTNGTYLFDPTQNTANASTSAEVLVLLPALCVTKTVDPTTSKAPHHVTYTITVTNSGNEPLTRTSVTDSLLIPHDISTSFPQTLAAGASSGPITFTRTILDSDPSSLVNTVTAIYHDSESFSATGTAQATVTVLHPSITVTKSVDQSATCIGQTINYTVTVTNTGDVSLNPSSVTDSMAGDLTSHFSGALAPNTFKSWSYPYVVKATDTSPLNNTAVAHYLVIGFPNDITASGSASTTISQPSIKVTKTANPTSSCPGTLITFTVTVKSNSCVDLNLQSFTDTFYTGAAPNLGFPAVLAAGATQSITYSYTVKATDPQPLVNTATAHYQVAGSATDITDTASITLDCIGQPPVVGGEVAYDNFSGNFIPFIGLGVLLISGAILVLWRRRANS
jgi:uncharacterized repeat protein (TIGR01451 family)